MKSVLLEAVEFVKKGDTKNAIKILGIEENTFSDKDIVDSLMSFQKGYSLMLSGQHSNAFEPLKNSRHVIDNATNSEAKNTIALYADFSEGISKLFSGDAVGAYSLLNFSKESLEKWSFFVPDLAKAALSTKAAATIALARLSVSIGDIGKTESLSGEIQQIYSELIAKLEKGNENDLSFFAEAYAVQLEFIIFMTVLDLNILNFDFAEKRIVTGEKLHADLINLLPKHKDVVGKIVIELDCSLYSSIKTIIKLAKKVIYEKSFLQEAEIAELKEVDDNLFKARALAYKAKERGKGYLFNINQLTQFQERLLILGKIKKRDFINISGLVSLFAFIILLFSVHLTFHPSGEGAIFYFIGEIIISIIIGFGYGALRFIPLIRLLTNAIEGKRDKIDTSIN